MFKLIIGFMQFTIELAAAELIFSCGAWAYNYASAGGLDTLDQCLYLCSWRRTGRSVRVHNLPGRADPVVADQHEFG